MLLKSLLAALVIASASITLGASEPQATLKVTHRALVPLCFNSSSVTDTRQWTVDSNPVTLAFTMRNQPRSGIRNVPPGMAVISFVPEPGHRYEVEVRADATAYSRRVYPEGEWMPVVRDRTTDQIVSGTPQRTDGACRP